GATYTIDFYTQPNLAGGVETRTYLGTRTAVVPASGSAAFDFTFPTPVALGTQVTAIATAPDGSSSGIAFAAAAVPPLAVAVTDPGVNDTQSYQWTVNGAAVAGATGPTFDYSPAAAGVYVVGVRVTDDDGGVGGAVDAVYVRGALPPAAILGAPATGLEGSPI